MRCFPTPLPLRPGALVLLASLALLVSTSPARAQDPGDRQRDAAQVATQQQVAHELKHEAIWAGARARLGEAREHAELVRRAKHGDKRALRALKARHVSEEEQAPDFATLEPATRAEVIAAARERAKPLHAFGVPTNAMCNNPAGDAPSAGQSEQWVASIGNHVLVAWNDGQGFNTGGDVQGFAYSVDGGATFTDGGDVLHPAGFPSWKWSSDPVVTVNEKTGEFWYCGLADPDASHNAIGVARGHFTGSTFAFDSAFVVRSELNTTFFLDKQWMVADSATGNLYITNTTFTATDFIDFYRSTNGGRTWSAFTTISAAADNGNVQGSRPQVGPSGEVSVAWYAAGPATADFLRYRRSIDGGVTFGTQQTPVSFNQQFGTGAPGFNRERGVNFPSIAVDRSSGPHRGRVYLAWNESFDFLDTPLPAVTSAISKLEPETPTSTMSLNDTPGTATPFTIGQVLRGTLTTKGGVRDNDYWSFPMTAGQSIIVEEDSITATRGFTLRIFGPDGVQREAYAGKPDSTTGSSLVYYSFMAASPGTYFIRLAAVTFRSMTYRVRTVAGTPGTHGEPGRDQRDAFVTFSDDGVFWSTAKRVNDDGPGYDNFLSEVAVGADGMPYSLWFDHRDDLVGSRAHIYLTRSSDGGTTWAANQRITTAQSNFTLSPTNISPNMGDYNAIASCGTTMYAAWSDGRNLGTSGVDVWAAGIPTTSDLATCPNDTTMNAASSAAFGWTLANHNPVFDGNYSVAWSADRGWPLPSGSVVGVPAASNTFYSASLAVPDTAKSGIVHVCLTLTGPAGVVEKTCCFALTVIGQALAVGDPPNDLSLAAAVPNPAASHARISYSLPRDGHVRLNIFDLAGARVRTLVDGTRPAGLASVTWDGRDEGGHAVHSGAYFYRLEFEGRSLTQRMVMLN